MLHETIYSKSVFSVPPLHLTLDAVKKTNQNDWVFIGLCIINNVLSLLIAFLTFEINTTHFYFKNGCRPILWMAENITFDHNTTMQLFFSNFLQNGHRLPFWIASITFDRIYRHFRSIYNFFYFIYFFIKWHLAAILDDPKITLDRISRHFRSMHKFF